MKTDYLNKVVQALDTGQLRYCREKLAQDSSKNTEEILAIFDAATNTKSAKALKNLVPNAKHLATLKKRVYYNVIDFVTTLEDQRKLKHNPAYKLKEAKSLLTLGLQHQAVDVALKGIEYAVELEELFIEVQLRELLRETLKTITDKHFHQITIDNEYALETAARKQLDLIKVTQVNDRMYRYYRSHRRSNNPQLIDAVEQLRQSPELHSGPPDSIPAQLRYYNALNIYYASKNELTTAIEMLQKHLELMELKPQRIKLYPNVYMSCLNNLLGKLNLTMRLAEAEQLLEKLHEFKAAGRRNRMLKFRFYLMQKHLFLMNSGKVTEACNLEEEIIKGINTYRKNLPINTIYVLTFNMGIAQLINGNNKRALFHFNTVKELGHSDVRHDMQGMAQLFRLLLLAIDDAAGLFQHQLRNAERFFKKKQSGYEIEKTFLHWLKRNHNRINTNGKAVFQSLFQELKPFADEDVIGAKEFLLFAQSQTSRKSLVELWKNHVQNDQS